VANDLAAPNYTFVAGSTAQLSVTPAVLSVDADPKAKVYGAGDPPLTYTLNGFHFGDTAATSGITGNGTCSRAPGEAVGSYTIACVANDLAAPNYTFVAGSTAQLSVSPRALTIKADNVGTVYGTAPSFTVTPIGLVSGDTLGSGNFAGTLGFSPAADASKPVGSYTITPSGLTSTNYTITDQTGTWTVSRKALTIKANNASKVYGSPNPAFAATPTGLVSGDSLGSANFSGVLALSTPATTASAVGEYPITPSGLTSSNYTISFVDGTLSVLYASSGTCAGGAGHTVLQPVNTDGSSVFKQGSTIPVKFRVCDANGVSIGTPGVVTSFSGVLVATGTEGPINETVVSTTPDTAFRWDGQQWIFNLSTKNLPANRTFVYTVALNDGSVIIFSFGSK
jgi:hypothetical protein